MTLVVHPHFHHHRTGATRHVEAVVPALAPHVETRVLESRVAGRVIAGPSPRIGWGELWRRARHEPVIWHAHRNGELMVGLLLRTLNHRLKLVFTRHASHRPSWITRLLARRADRVISLTDEIARAVELPSTVVAHGVDVSRFHPPPDRHAAWRALGLGGRFGIGVIGRIRPAKGQGDFAEAIAPLLPANPEWRAILVGSALGGDQAWADGLPKLAPGLQLVGEHANIVPWYQGLTVLVQPSYAEGLSLAFLEGLASGCCVVASRVSDFPRMVEHGRTGFLFDPGDVKSLRELLAMLMSDPARAQAVGAAAAEEARARFGLDREASALWNVYEELVANT